jgi:hypothetical protein
MSHKTGRLSSHKVTTAEPVIFFPATPASLSFLFLFYLSLPHIFSFLLLALFNNLERLSAAVAAQAF